MLDCDIQIIKRSGEVAPFDASKIKDSVVKACIATGSVQSDDTKIDDIVASVTQEVSERFVDFLPNVENIQDIIEKHLMKYQLYDAAKAYILYRAERQDSRDDNRKKKSFLKKLTVRKSNGRIVLFNYKKIEETVQRNCQGYEVNPDWIIEEAIKNIYDGVTTEEIDRALILASSSLIENNPDYSKVAARFFLQKIRKEVFGESIDIEDLTYHYQQGFIDAIETGVKHELLDKRMLDFDLVKLSEALVVDRDELFEYIGVQTIYERYLLKYNNVRLELPQSFWMRVAMGLAIAEENKTEEAIKFYHILSTFRFVSSTPTLFHAGTTCPQLSSCYLTTIPDDLGQIFKCLGDNAQLSKWSGGLGNDWTPVRATGSWIKSTKVESQGVIPFLKIANDTTAAINRSGKRRGATCAYLETWHLDIEDFLDLRKNTGDERRRTHDMNTANWIPDLFMQRVIENGNWTLFSPEEVPDLHEIYGSAFAKQYVKYEKLADEGKIKKFKRIEANKLWKKMLTMLFETGHPWLCFSTPCNVRSPQDHCGVVHSSNLCCVTGDQRVACDKGLVRVDDLYKSGKENIVVGKHKYEKASKMLLPRPDAPIVKILTKEGYTHKVTPDHKVWVKDHGYKEAQDLIAGDLLEIQQIPGMFGKTHEPEIAFLCGLIAGDGTYSKSSVHIDIWEPIEEYFLCRVENYVGMLIERFKNKLPFDHAAYEYPKFQFNEEAKKHRLSSSSLRMILESFGFTKETKLVVPEFVWQGDKETVSAYLEGLYYADGTVCNDKEITTVSFASVNKKLVEDLQIIWANLGCKTYIGVLREEAWRPMPDGKGGQKEYFCQKIYRLLHTSIKASKIANEVTKIGNYRGKELFLENIQKDGYVQKMYCTFTGLEQLPNEDAYCLEVYNDDHLWTVNGILTKNTEITLNTSPEETAVCNIGSVNLASHYVNGKLNHDMLAETVKMAIRMLDNVIDENFYPTIEAKNSNFKHRPIGLGMMGLQDALFLEKLPFDTEAAVEYSDRVMELIAYNAILASSELAKEKGSYSSYDGSKWSRNIFPQDTLKLLEEERGQKIPVVGLETLDWSVVRDHVKQYGMRNSNVMAIAPTATISNIAGCYPCIEPIYKNIYVKANISGEFVVINKYLVNDLKAIGLWNDEMIQQIKYHDGNLNSIPGISQELKSLYKEAFDIDPKWLILHAAARGKWIDQSQSLNIFMKGASGKKLDAIYKMAFEYGIKTTYYLRTLAASQIEKSTLDASKFGFTQIRKDEEVPMKACRLDNPDCESCQ